MLAQGALCLCGWVGAESGGLRGGAGWEVAYLRLIRLFILVLSFSSPACPFPNLYPECTPPLPHPRYAYLGFSRASIFVSSLPYLLHSTLSHPLLPHIPPPPHPRYAYLGFSRGESGPGRWLELLLTFSFCPIATFLVVRIALSTCAHSPSTKAKTRGVHPAATNIRKRVDGKTAGRNALRKGDAPLFAGTMLPAPSLPDLTSPLPA
jgi:hypothetical protein